MSLLPLDFLAVEEKMEEERPTEQSNRDGERDTEQNCNTANGIDTYGKREEIYNAAELRRRNAIRVMVRCRRARAPHGKYLCGMVQVQ